MSVETEILRIDCMPTDISVLDFNNIGRSLKTWFIEGDAFFSHRMHNHGVACTGLQEHFGIEFHGFAAVNTDKLPFDRAGLIRGPSMLNMVLMPSSLRIWATRFIDGWKSGAKRNENPVRA